MDYSTYSVRQLKITLQRRNVDYSDCIEKSDLIEKAKSTEHLEPKRNDGDIEHRKNIHLNDGLYGNVVDSSDNPDTIILVLHGYGANANDLTPIADSVIKSNISNKKVKFIIPEAILDLGGGSKAWWPIDIMNLISAFQSGNVQSILEDVPEGIEAARSAILNLINKEFGINEDDDENNNSNDDNNDSNTKNDKRLIIAGFSQGGMLSMDIALRIHPSIKFTNLLLFSTTIICKNEWEPLIDDFKNRDTSVQVFQSHGKSDPIIPFFIGQHLQSFLTDSDINVEFVEFNGGHTVPNQSLVKMRDILNE